MDAKNNEGIAEEKRSKVSAFVITLNEEDQIGDCLRSLQFCDELIVIDAHSTDKTREIAKEFGARVIERAWPGYVNQKTFGLEQCSNRWVLSVDADERVNAELRLSILDVMKSDAKGELKNSIVGYECNRVMYFLGRWWRKGGWFPEYRLRLFLKDKVRWSKVLVHEKLIPEGPVDQLVGEIEHYSFDNLEDQFQRYIKYSSLAAEEYSGGPVGVKELIISPLIRFFKFFVLKYGFREGRPGLIVAITESFYTFFKYAKIWEKQNIKQISLDKKVPLSEFPSNGFYGTAENSAPKNGEQILEESVVSKEEAL